MRHAKLDTSPRLQKVLVALQGGAELSTRDIILRTGVCAVNSCIAELRANGAEISCRQTSKGGQRIFLYTLLKSPEDSNA